MGFPSPATDYIESTLTVNSLCNITANSRVIPTDRGYVVLGLSLKVKQGSILLIRSVGELQFAKLMGRSFITVEGESIQGDAMDEVEVLGVATHVINDMRQDDSPII
ncbi:MULTISPECIES: hypothetical protein [Klebsiella]|uniref:DNA polymerase V subunit UmuD n=4 Tax=Klebsiella pneumoniae TaxID=573 RepID=A0A939SUY8_KLEPN|nr:MULTISPECIES: hypothetical protein [Klebsiella]AUD16924.1 hypothetical protein CXB26_08300 [Klebsiella pneumoniae]AUD27792.1 hypothetical protein CXB24_08305 [Klebsiella pneumoniae]AUD33341.1 hypothetical protein CXB25_08295 [Klebsiella pneumoniae]AWG11647.1 hypothetical protein C2861_07625 [Klebsiella pneumoniae]AYC82905.1 hypothetical protein CJ257_07805 [Klebsiella pneumoniae]